MAQQLERPLIRQWLGRHAQHGAALVTGMMTVTTLSVVGVTASMSSVNQARMASNYHYSIEALNSAEVGVGAAVDQFNAGLLSADGFSDELDPNGDGSTVDRLTWVLADAARNIHYRVVVTDDDDGDGNTAVDTNGIVRLMSQGASDLGSTRSVDVRISDTAGPPSPGTPLQKAVLTQESLILSGNSEYNGSNTDIHSNEDVWQTDHVTTDGNITAGGTAHGGDPSGGGSASSNADKVVIPDIDPSDFEDYVDYVFHSNGYIYDAADAFVADANGSAWNGWKFSGDKWTTEGDDVQEGFFYFKGEHGNVVVGSKPGTYADPWNISFLADGYIEISGNPYISNEKDTDDPPAVQNILFMAGTDIKINGNADQTFIGLIAAAEQVEISGNPNIHGAVLAGGKDNSATNQSDLVKFNQISGQLVLTYNGDIGFPNGTPGSGTVILLSWQEREIARGTDVFAGY